jgi:hypothetical protein
LEEIGEDNGELAFILLFDNVWKLHYVIRCLLAHCNMLSSSYCRLVIAALQVTTGLRVKRIWINRMGS